MPSRKERKCLWRHNVFDRFTKTSQAKGKQTKEGRYNMLHLIVWKHLSFIVNNIPGGYDKTLGSGAEAKKWGES